jgi:hypothetical protein
MADVQVKVSGDQVAKVRRDLDMVQGNMAVFAEMLSEMKPGNENPQDLELIQVRSHFSSLKNPSHAFFRFCAKES